MTLVGKWEAVACGIAPVADRLAWRRAGELGIEPVGVEWITQRRAIDVSAGQFGDVRVGVIEVVGKMRSDGRVGPLEGAGRDVGLGDELVIFEQRGVGLADKEVEFRTTVES